MLATGVRGTEVIELAVAAGRPNAIVEIARQHLDKAIAPEAQRAALEGLASLRTTHARELLQRQASRTDGIGLHARSLLSAHDPSALSERELEVLHLAGDGLTNRQIAERLVLSEHTIARHLANARAKLGAANRAAAAAMVSR
jgi:DNA-binding NarL/FixJ family response regulator